MNLNQFKSSEPIFEFVKKAVISILPNIHLSKNNRLQYLWFIAEGLIHSSSAINDSVTLIISMFFI